jgi:ABC-2 type transport system permease protein
MKPHPKSSVGTSFWRFLIRTRAMAGKEMLHIRRDPRTLYLALGMPVLMLLLFGYGVRFEIERLPLAIVDQDHTRASIELVDAFVAAGEFQAVVTLDSPDAADAEFRAARVGAALVIERGFEHAIMTNATAPLQLLVDGSDGVVANQILAKADAIVRTHGRSLLPLQLQAFEPPLQVSVWTRYNPGGASAIFMVPGLAAYLMAISAVLLTALTVAGEWERGSMEQLFASPVGRLEIVLGKLLPYLALGLVELLVVVAFGMLAFEVPFRGSPIALFSIGFFFLVGMLGQGLLISVITKNQLVATQAGALSALLPSMLLSGMLFPIENMPAPLQALSHVIPARYLVHALRGVLLKGNGLDTLWPDLLAQIGFSVLIIAIATARFPRRLA